MFVRLLAALILVFASVNSGHADEAALAAISSGEVVFVGKIAKVTAGPVGLSSPPLRTYSLVFDVKESLRGAKPTGPLGYQVRQDAEPAFPEDASWIVAARKTERRWQITCLVPADKQTLEKAKTLAALPAGWRLEAGKIVSPWAILKEKAWPAGAEKPAGPVCSQSNRPALLTGPDIEFTVAQVPAKNPQRFRNDMFGDGQFLITVKNLGTKPVEVPSVLTDGKTIFWADSVFAIVQNQPHLLAGAGQAKGAKALTLEPGQSVSGTIDTLTLDGIDWPRGGSRVYFDFALGEKTATNFFYYFSDLHDRLRAEALRNLKSK